MSSIVVDASALIDLLFGFPRAPGVARALGAARPTSPAHLDVEVLRFARRLLLRGDLDEARAGEILADLGRFPVERVQLHGLSEQAWALRHNVSTDDAYYVALADRLEAPLVTTDRRLAQAPGLGIEVRLVT